MIFKSLAKEPLARISLIILAVLYTTIIFADFIAPYPPELQNAQAGYAPPSKIYLDWSKGFYLHPRRLELNLETYKKETIENKSERYYLQFFKQGKLVSLNCLGDAVNAVLGSDSDVGSKSQWYQLCSSQEGLNFLGTDQLGRDLLSRLIYGGRPSLSIGFIGLLIAFPLGILYGGISGFFGSWIDNLMMRLAEAIMSLPSFYLLIILSALMPANLDNVQRFTIITIILSFISWAGLSRVVRGQVLSIKEQEFIEAAKSIGQSNIVIIVKHLIPHTFSYLVIAATLSVPAFIIGESALSFLGLGINQPDPSWGNILAEGKELSNILTRPWLMWAPAMLIFASVFSFNMIGDRLRDVLDPKLD